MLTWKEEIPKECYPSDVPCKVTAIEWNLQRICKLSYFYPQLSNVADIMLSTPVSNVRPEMGVSCVKQVKTRFRSNLQNDMLQPLLQVSINGPAAGTDADKSLTEEAVKTWTAAKCRRRLPRGQGNVASCSNSQSYPVLIDARGQTDSCDERNEQMSAVDITEEVEALSKALNLPDADVDDEADYDEGFEDEDYD